MQFMIASKGKSVGDFIAVALLLFLVVPSNAFIRHLCFNPLGFARIDPLVSPGDTAEHVHHLHGANNLSIDSVDANVLLASNCTSCSITVDKSVYWTPAMYFQHGNGTFSSMTTASAITIYYKLEKRANFENRNYTVFPKGFRMLAGTNSKRKWVGPWPVPEQSNWGPNDTTQAALAEKAIGFNCLNYGGAGAEASLAYPYIRNKTFTDAHCSDGLRAELLFPSCWDGVNLDSADHKSHVAYPTLIQDGACPDTHPVYLPVLFFETIWNTQEFTGTDGQYVFANGDPTGYGYHADFIAAWQDGVLQRVMEDPTCTDHDLNNRHSDGIQEKCLAVKDSIQSPAVASQCKISLPDILKKDKVSGLLDTLPNLVKVTGERHDPGNPPADHDPAAPSEALSVTTAESTASSHASPSAAVVPPLTTAPPTLDTTILPDISGSFAILSTSTYVENNILYEVIIAETVVTETVTAASPSQMVARHRHGHGHRLGHPY